MQNADDPLIRFTSPFGVQLSVGNSSIHAKGLFSGQYIPSGTRLIEYIGERVTSAEADRREEENDRKGTTYIFILDDTTCIDGAVGGNEAQYINHSCNPNCKYVYQSGHIYIDAIKDIPEGSELTYDYEFEPEEPPTPCCCGSDSCRGTINIRRSEYHS